MEAQNRHTWAQMPAQILTQTCLHVGLCAAVPTPLIQHTRGWPPTHLHSGFDSDVISADAQVMRLGNANYNVPPSAKKPRIRRWTTRSWPKFTC